MIIINPCHRIKVSDVFDIENIFHDLWLKIEDNDPCQITDISVGQSFTTINYLDMSGKINTCNYRKSIMKIYKSGEEYDIMSDDNINPYIHFPYIKMSDVNTNSLGGKDE